MGYGVWGSYRGLQLCCAVVEKSRVEYRREITRALFCFIC